MSKLFFRAFNEFKTGWLLPELPLTIIKIQNKLYIKILRILGPLFLFLSLNVKADQLDFFIYYLILLLSFLYLLYRLIIGFYYLKQSILVVFSGKLIVRNSPLNYFNTIFRCVGCAAKSTANFTLSTGIAYALCHELDEILINEGKEPYFVPKFKHILKKTGSEDLAKKFLNAIGIKDRTTPDTPVLFTQFLDNMSPEQIDTVEKVTGLSWNETVSAIKKFETVVQTVKSPEYKTVTKAVSEYIDKEDPFDTNKK